MGNPYTENLTKTLANEGGFTVDSGGATNFGITQKTLDNFTTTRGLPKIGVKQLTPDIVQKLYYEDYYKGPGFDALPQEVGSVMFDYGVNSGTGKAVKSLQKIVGADVDGIIGPQTKAAVQKYVNEKGATPLVNEVLDDRLDFVRGLAKSKPELYGKYLKGWEARIERQRPKEKK